MKGVSQELWAAVFRRDGGCVAAQPDKVGPENVHAGNCRDMFGRETPWNDPRGKTAEHVKMFHGMGLPRKHVAEQLVIVCWQGVQGWELRHKDDERRYLARLYPEYWQEWTEIRAEGPP